MTHSAFLFASKGNDPEKETPSINSAIVSLNLRPLTAKKFTDPVVITLRHTVVSLVKPVLGSSPW